MAEPVMIMVELDEMGVIGGIYTAGVPVRYVIVNYDTQGALPGDTRKVDGVSAYVDGGDAFADGPAVLAAFKAWEG